MGADDYSFSFEILEVGYASIGKIKLKKIIIQIKIDKNLKKLFDKEFLLKFSRGGA